MEDSAESERFAFFKMLRNQLFSSHQTRLEEVENISAFEMRHFKTAKIWQLNNYLPSI